MGKISDELSLRVGQRLQAQSDLKAFCLTLCETLALELGANSCKLFVRKEKETTWSLIADYFQDNSRYFHPPTCLTLKQQAEMELLSDSMLCGIKYIQDPPGVQISLSRLGSVNGLILLQFDTIPATVGKDLELLKTILSAEFDVKMLDNCISEEKQLHAETEKKLIKTLNSQERLLEQLHTLHKISFRLWLAHSLDNMLHTAIYECIRSLDFDRMAIFLLNSRSGLLRGTYGTSIDGKVTNEQSYCTAISEHFHAKATLDKRQHITINDNTPLYHDNVQVGVGWNATISLWDGDEPIGWIAVDNLITRVPLQEYHHELLKLLGVTMSQHLVQRWAQDDLKALNQSLEYRVAERTAQLEKANNQLNRLSREDTLTGVPNRRVLDEKMEEEWRRALRYQTPLTLLIVDIDNFKQYNDLYGHAQGDHCLINVATALSNVDRRAGALLSRFGGEEFVFLLPNCDKKNAALIAKRAVETIAALEIPHGDSETSQFVTISAGCKTIVPSADSTPRALFIEADVALYECKSSGKNQAFCL